MSSGEQKEKWLDRLRKKHRLVSMDTETFVERWSLNISGLNFILLITGSFLLVAILTWILIAYTPVRELIPGYPDGTEREIAIQNKLELEKVKREFEQNARMLNTIQTILEGGVPGDTTVMELDTSQLTEEVPEVEKSTADSLLRIQIEQEQKWADLDQGANLDNVSMEGVFFFSPLRGMVSQSFDPPSGHLGVDVIAPEKSPVLATLDGTVTFASWTSDAGHVIQVQHGKNLISVYKHNSVLLKKVGDNVQAGDPIAIIGNSGMYSSGPHLHFELWQAGIPLDPQKYIGF